MAQASGHIIFPQLPIGSSKRAYYFSPTTKWLKQAGILFSPNYQLAPASGHIIFPHSIGSSKRAYYFSPFNRLQQGGIFFQNIKLAPGSRHIFPNHQLAPASVHIIFPAPASGHIFSQHSIGSSKRAYYTGQQIFTDLMVLR